MLVDELRYRQSLLRVIRAAAMPGLNEHYDVVSAVPCLRAASEDDAAFNPFLFHCCICKLFDRHLQIATMLFREDMEEHARFSLTRRLYLDRI